MSSLAITNNTLDLVLPIDQGKHLPRFTLQSPAHYRDILINLIGPTVSLAGLRDKAYLPIPATSPTFRDISDTPAITILDQNKDMNSGCDTTLSSAPFNMINVNRRFQV